MEKILLSKYKEMDETERRKVKELLKDKHKNEESVEKIGWLYKPDKPDAEEYLLGRRIDKAIEKDLEKESADKDAPGALFTEVMSRRAEMDMQVKMREDPLYAIRRKEEEERRKVMNNPVKMKQLMKVLEEKKEKSKKKKDKKKGKKKHRKSSSSDESEDELLNKYLAIVEQKKKKNGTAEQKGHEEKHGHTSSRNKSDSHLRNRSFNDEKKSLGEKLQYDRKQRKSTHSNSEERSDREMHTSRLRSETIERHKDRMHHNSEGDNGDKSSNGQRFKRYGLNKARDDSSPEIRKRRRSNSNEGRYAHRRKSVSPVDNRRRDHSPQPVKRKLTSEEMERKRIEMMENARLRDEERQANIKRYREEDNESEKKNQKMGGARFIKPMILSHTEKSSVEDRIKRNKYNIQRTTADLDKNFTKR